MSSNDQPAESQLPGQVEPERRSNEELTGQRETTTAPQTDIVAPSPSTEGSVTAYIERTLVSMGEVLEALDVPPLPPHTEGKPGN